MYRYGNGQISLSDFQQPMGMCLREDNRWVKKAQLLPWCKIEAKYAGYDDSKPPFDPSSMVHFRKRLTPEILAEINEMVIQAAGNKDDQNNNSGGGGNSGTMIVDATCAPSNIRYPQDVSQLNEARENAEKLLDVLHAPADGKKPRSYRKCDRKDCLKYVRCRKHTAKMTRKAISKQLNYLKRDLTAGEERDKVQDYQDECERVEVERKFSLGKRKCGMGLVTAKLEDTAAHVVALSILLLNLRKIQYAFLQFLDWLLGFLQPREKLRVVQ